MDLRLAPLARQHLELMYRIQLEPNGNAMAVAIARSWDEFTTHWRDVIDDSSVFARTVVVDGEIAGWINVFPVGGRFHVGYWLSEHFWGRGVATWAMRSVLDLVATRPIHARVAESNVPSIRVLEKCGFVIQGCVNSPATPRFPSCREMQLTLRD